MRAPLSGAAQEVAEALAITSERTAADGAPWCPPRDADLVRRWVTDRGRELGGGIRRVVRLARLLMAAEGSYLQFLHVRLPTLRGRNFKVALQAAAAAGRLPRAVATLSDAGARLVEAALRPPNAIGFDIDFAQMPRLAALLDVLHNALGFGAVEDLLAPILARGAPGVHADEVARSLHAKFNAWLSERLESPHYIRQAQKMRAFLASRGPVAPDAIDDEAILAFWIAAAATPGDTETEGFRLYRSSARGMLRYRRALRDAEAYRQIGMPLDLDDHVHRQPDPSNDAVAIDIWQSPLCALAARPANAVKWLNKRERLWLLNYLGGPHPEREEPEDEAPDAAGEAAADTGLVDAERFDLRFVRTLLRADVFGPVQSNLVAALRRRTPPAAAIGQALAQAGDGAYESCATSYGAVGEQLRIECLAALVPLLAAGAPEALHLVSYLGGREALSQLMGPDARDRAALIHAADEGDGPEAAPAPGLGARLAALERAAAAGPEGVPAGPLRTLLQQAHAALRKVGRIGFRREDRDNAATTPALAAGAAAVVDILRELDRLLPALSEAAPPAAIAEDRGCFEAAFRRIYATQRAGGASAT